MCHGGNRTVFLEEGQKCIVHVPEAPLISKYIYMDASKTLMLNMSDVSIGLAVPINRTDNDFIFYEEYIDACSQVELSYLIILLSVGGLVAAVIIAAFAVCLTCRYKKQYYQLLDTKGEPKDLKEIPGKISCCSGSIINTNNRTNDKHRREFI